MSDILFGVAKAKKKKKEYIKTNEICESKALH